MKKTILTLPAVERRSLDFPGCGSNIMPAILLPGIRITKQVKHIICGSACRLPGVPLNDRGESKPTREFRSNPYVFCDTTI